MSSPFTAASNRCRLFMVLSFLLVNLKPHRRGRRGREGKTKNKNILRPRVCLPRFSCIHVLVLLFLCVLRVLRGKALTSQRGAYRSPTPPGIPSASRNH